MPDSGKHAAERICVVGIGASAGGLEACRGFLAALPASSGVAFILIQHLDPTHESMMVELLGGSAAIPVIEATDGIAIEPDHLYVIPPGVYLSLDAGLLHLSRPAARHGARLPIDFFLNTLASAAGARGICVILSGTGADGALGCQAVKAAGGLVIAQDPEEAAFDGMPRSAIASGAVDLVLPVEQIAGALLDYARGGGEAAVLAELRELPRIIELLRRKSAHDFSLYKTGTLIRRIARRMAMAGIAPNDTEKYLAVLERDVEERGRLAEDLLINVTKFFRDPKIFEVIATTVVPELVNGAGAQAIRIWVAGCSTGEETYSLAMLFQEQLSAGNSPAKLQMFASDVDGQAVSSARDGLYPFTIEADVSPARLARFFIKEEQGYRISQELRSKVVFAVQDVLADPPFSKLDLVSCRNLLIYLRPEAQAKIISIFNFSLRRHGFLLLGSAETAGGSDTRFSVVSKPARLYRKVAHSGPGDIRAFLVDGETVRNVLRRVGGKPAPRPTDLAEICRKMLLEQFAPAAILINPRLECLYSTGPTAPYLRVAPGYPTLNILTMLHPALRARAKAAITIAAAGTKQIIVPGGRVMKDGVSVPFNLDIQQFISESEKLLLVCFIEQPAPKPGADPGLIPESSRYVTLEAELTETRAELQEAVRGLEVSAEEQNAINEEALAVNEEYQSTNEELLTSKEELQSLNEELTALNSQLQETLERSRMTSNDLQNILFSTDVATLFLDTKLNIRFFTPATKALFTIIAGDVGRPLADFNALVPDANLLTDATAVMRGSKVMESEIAAPAGRWFNRRILPYRTHERAVEGVVITFTDITDRKKIGADLLEAQRGAERATLAKSRFLAAASHDLRQPLQTITLLNGLLGKTVHDGAAKKLLARLDDTAEAMAATLNALLDINQIDSGIVTPHISSAPVNDILLRLYQDFSEHAQDNGLALRMVPCSLHIRTDPALLEQIVRNLVSNALKYTREGKVLLGCRRRGAMLSIEICDSGMGIPAAEVDAIFEEFHQLDNPNRERSRGLGLGLSIVQRLALLLGLRVRVNSVFGRGSVFAIDVPCEPAQATAETPAPVAPSPAVPARGGRILVIEDDETIRELLEMFLREEGFLTEAAADGQDALRLVASGKIDPDLILADYNLPGGVNGLETANRLRELQRRKTPVIILSGDISTQVLREIAAHNFVQVGKPMRLAELVRLIDETLAASPPRPAAAVPVQAPVIFIVDDDPRIRATFSAALAGGGRQSLEFASSELFLAAYVPGQAGCLLVDANLPGMDGLGLLRHLAEAGHHLPSIMITGQGDVKMAVAAMRAGALDFLEKPVSLDALRAAVELALEQGQDSAKLLAVRETAALQLATLTHRQREIMDLVLAGHPSKNIAADLGISQRTVENHRSAIMMKTGAKSLPALARLALAVDGEK